jgi:membrane-bound lytic murein transglycosylase MltF
LSSYYQSLLDLNARLDKDGKAPVKITPAPEELEDEDLLEMTNAGLVDILVVDDYQAWFWQRVWPRLKLYPSVALRRGGTIAWAIRKDSPQLKTALDNFLATTGAGADASRKRFTDLVALFRKYGAQYEMDWMLMAAQGYQESRLDHSALAASALPSSG